MKFNPLCADKTGRKKLQTRVCLREFQQVLEKGKLRERGAGEVGCQVPGIPYGK